MMFEQINSIVNENNKLKKILKENFGEVNINAVYDKKECKDYDDENENNEENENYIDSNQKITENDKINDTKSNIIQEKAKVEQINVITSGALNEESEKDKNKANLRLDVDNDSYCEGCFRCCYCYCKESEKHSFQLSGE